MANSTAIDPIPEEPKKRNLYKKHSKRWFDLQEKKERETMGYTNQLLEEIVALLKEQGDK